MPQQFSLRFEPSMWDDQKYNRMISDVAPLLAIQAMSEFGGDLDELHLNRPKKACLVQINIHPEWPHIKSIINLTGYIIRCIESAGLIPDESETSVITLYVTRDRVGEPGDPHIEVLVKEA